MSFPLTTAYAQFVNAGLINHLNQHGKAVYLPGYIKEGKNDLAAYLKPRLENAFKEQIQRIKEQDDSELFNPPPLEGDEAKEFLQKVLEIAKDNDIVGASSALDKINEVLSKSSPPANTTLPADTTPPANTALPANTILSANTIPPAHAIPPANTTPPADATPPANTTPPSNAIPLANTPPANTTPPGNATISKSRIYDPINRSAVEYWKTTTVTETYGRIRILAEEKTKRPSRSLYSSDGKQSNYIVEVQNPVTGKYMRKIVPTSYVSHLLPQWRQAENPMILYTYTEDNKTEEGEVKMEGGMPAKKNIFKRDISGPLTKFHWFACRDRREADQDTMSRSPVTKCCVEFLNEDGPHVLLMNELKNKFLQSWELENIINESAKIDDNPTPKERTPQRYSEVNLLYHDPTENRDPLRREPKTWREIKDTSYAEKGITTPNRAMPDNPAQYSPIATGTSRQQAYWDAKKIFSQISAEVSMDSYNTSCTIHEIVVREYFA